MMISDEPEKWVQPLPLWPNTACDGEKRTVLFAAFNPYQTAWEAASFQNLSLLNLTPMDVFLRDPR
jgi:hypothetical protein